MQSPEGRPRRDLVIEQQDRLHKVVNQLIRTHDFTPENSALFAGRLIYRELMLSRAENEAYAVNSNSKLERSLILESIDLTTILTDMGSGDYQDAISYLNERAKKLVTSYSPMHFEEIEVSKRLKAITMCLDNLSAPLTSYLESSDLEIAKWLEERNTF